jgi:putative membrane protein (TIGR04086 family)
MYNDRKRGKGGLPAQKRQVGIAQRTHATEEEPIIKAVLLSSLFGVLASVLSGGILLTVLCFVALGSDDPLSLIAPLSLLALLPSNFLGGFISTKKSDCPPMPCGAICAAMWMLLSLVVALCLPYPSSDHVLWQSVFLHGASVLFCILGAFAGSYKPRKDTRKKHRFGGK